LGHLVGGPVQAQCAMTDVAAVGGAARSCEDLDDAPRDARALAAGITASRKGSLAGDRQSFDSVAMHSEAVSNPYAPPTADLLLVGRARLRCPVITEPRLCPATSQPAWRHRTSVTRTLRRRLVEGLPFTDSRVRERASNLRLVNCAVHRGIPEISSRISRRASFARLR
jgi:hypothetical protein